MATEVAQLREAAQLKGDGIAVTLADGIARRCVFDFEALYRLEEAAGTLQAWLDEAGDGGYQKRKLWAVTVGLEAGLYRYADPRMQEDPRYLPTKLLRRQLVFRDMDAYLDAVTEAFWQAMGQPDEAVDPKAEADSSAAPSPGATSTPLPLSDSAAATTSSGA
jgi:hypothetical protein